MVPYLVVLVGALIGVNVFIVLVLGTVLSLVVGLATGAFAVSEMFGVMASGITGMYDITVISIVVAGIIALVKENGGIEYILQVIQKRINNPKGAQLGIAALASLVDVSTANNTIAIVMAGPIAKDISDKYDLEPKRTASLLDIFTSVWQGVIPYGAQLLYASAGATAAGVALSPFDIIPFLYYPLLMAVSALLFIFFGKSAVRKH